MIGTGGKMRKPTEATKARQDKLEQMLVDGPRYLYSLAKDLDVGERTVRWMITSMRADGHLVYQTSAGEFRAYLRAEGAPQ